MKSDDVSSAQICCWSLLLLEFPLTTFEQWLATSATCGCGVLSVGRMWTNDVLLDGQHVRHVLFVDRGKGFYAPNGYITHKWSAALTEGPH